MVCPLYRGCPLLRGSNHIILIGRDKFGDLVLSFVERYLIQCPFLGGSSLRGFTVVQINSVFLDSDNFSHVMFIFMSILKLSGCLLNISDQNICLLFTTLCMSS